MHFQILNLLRKWCVREFECVTEENVQTLCIHKWKSLVAPFSQEIAGLLVPSRLRIFFQKRILTYRVKNKGSAFQQTLHIQVTHEFVVTIF